MSTMGVTERVAQPVSVREPSDRAGGGREDATGWADSTIRRCAGSTCRSGPASWWRSSGPSGSGKTTILNLVTGIDRPTAGTVTVDGRRIDSMSEEELAVWRGEHVGVVFQFFQLLPTLSALENAVLPLDFARRGSKRERFERARHNLELVGLGDKARPSAGGAVGRRAAAGRDRARACVRSEADRRRRADRQPRHGDRGGDVRAARAAERGGQDGPLRHARPRARARGRTGSSRSATASSSRREEADMVSALLRKSITDLSRRRSRTVFAVATLALAVASIGHLRDADADGPLDAVGGRAQSKLPDLTVVTSPPRPRPRAARRRSPRSRTCARVEPRSWLRRARLRRRAPRTGVRPRGAGLRAADRRCRPRRLRQRRPEPARCWPTSRTPTRACSTCRRARPYEVIAADGTIRTAAGERRGPQPERRPGRHLRQRRRPLRDPRHGRSLSGAPRLRVVRVPSRRHPARRGAARRSRTCGGRSPSCPGFSGFTRPARGAVGRRLARQGRLRRSSRSSST